MKKNKLLALLMALVMTLTLVPVTAFATEAPVAQIGEIGYGTLVEALAHVTKDAPLTFVSDDVWPSNTPVYYNGNFYGATDNKGALENAMEAANTANADTAALIYVRPNYDQDGGDTNLLKGSHQNIKTSMTIFGNNAHLNFGWEPTVECPGDDYHELNKNVVNSIYNLHDGAGFWGARSTEYTVTLNMANCQNVHEVLLNGSTTGNGQNTYNIDNCTFTTKYSTLPTIGSMYPTTMNITGCTFTGLSGNYIINLNNKCGGTSALNISDCTFTNCGGTSGKGIVRANGENVGATVSLTASNLTFTDSADNSLCDIQIGHATEPGDNKVVVSYNVSESTGKLNVYTVNTASIKTGEPITMASGESYVGNNAVPADVAQIGDNGQKYPTLDAAIDAANNGDTIKLLADVSNVGAISLPANVTLDGQDGETKHTISGDSAIYINAAGGTVENVKFFDTNNSSGTLSAIYASGLSGSATITGCEFGTIDWDAIQITPKAGAVITITDNTFGTAAGDNVRRYIHVQSTGNQDFTATITGNKMYTPENLMYTSIEVYFPTDWNKINISNNYVANPIGVCLLSYDANNSYVNHYETAIHGFVDEDNASVSIKAIIDRSGDTYLFPDLAKAVSFAKNGDTITLLADCTAATVNGGKNITFALNGHKLSGNQWVIGDATLTIDGTVANSEFYGCICVGYATNNNGNVVLNGGYYHCGNNDTVLHINGTCLDSDVTIRNARIESPSDNGIQLNGSGTFVIENSEITGATGVYVKSGDLTITGSKITGNMSPANYSYNGNGANATGDAIVIDSCNYPGGAPLVKIGAGNTFTGTKNQVGYYVYNNSAEGTVLAESAYTLSTNADKNWVDNNNETYTKKIGDVTYVAQIGDVKYETLQAAIAAANPNDTITLLADVGDANSQFGTYKSMTLDLGGHTLTCAWLFAYYNATLTVENGTINGNVESYGIYGAPTVTIANNATVNGYLLGWGNGNEPDSDNYYQPTLNVYGKVRNANYFAICTNGMDNHNPIINIYDGAEVTSTTESAIYLPSGTLNIVGGTITGATGVYFKSKTLNITGGTITGNGTKTDYTYNGNGANATGDALVIDSCNYPNGISDITVSGGTFTSENGFAVGSYNSKGGKLQTGFITGGTFSSDPMNFPGGNLVKESYAAVKQGNTYKVGVVSTSGVSAGEKNTADDTVTYGITTTVTDESNDVQLSEVVSSAVTVAGTKVENNAITVTDSTVKASAVGAASLDSVNSNSMSDVVSNAIVSAGDNADSVNRIELVIVSDSGTEVTDSNNAVTSVTYEVHPEAIAYTVVSDTATKVGSYKITNDQLAANASFTIKLPVPDAIYTTAAHYANNTSPRVKVTHYSDDANYGDTEETLEIQGTAGNYFVEVITDHFSEFALEPDVTGDSSTGNSVYACNLQLQGIVKVQYALNLTDSIQNDKDAYVVITMPNVGVSETIKVSAATNNLSYKVVAFSVAAQYMDEDTYVTLYNGNGIEVAFDNSNVADGDFAGSYKYGVYSYLDSNTVKNGSVYLQNLASSMKTYNQYAKYYFHPTEVVKPTLALPTITSAELNTYVKATSGSVDDLSMYAANLQLKESTTVQIAYSGSIDGVTFSYTLKDGDTVHMSGNELTAVRNGNYWVIAVTDIAAQYLDDILTVTATKGEDSYAVTYSPFTYVSNKLSSTTAGLSETVRAFYGYNQAANEYFANK